MSFMKNAYLDKLENEDHDCHLSPEDGCAGCEELAEARAEAKVERLAEQPHRDEITRSELNAWQQYQIGKPCAKHPGHIIKNGRFGLWCGVKTAFGWCDGGWPTEEWLASFRKEQHVTR
jgi:hypothetical protein